MEYHTHTLSNGLRIIHLPHPSPVVYCGYAIAAGSRHEAPGQEGLAHFCEHATFKGTARRPALSVLTSLEAVGGDLNAFTNKEHTVFHAAVLGRHVRRAVSLLTDMVFFSTYPPTELEKEMEVVCDEIESYNDSPAELIYDDFENLLFDGHPLGHAILGTAERVRSFTQADVVAFTRRHYRTDNAVFFAYGQLRFDRLVRLLEQLTPAAPALLPVEPASAPTTEGTVAPVQTRNDVVVRRMGTHQAHVVLGTLALPHNHPQRLPLFLLNNLLGGPAMSARLNVALRERRGLVYTVESSVACYADTGCWTTYFGCDANDVDRCLRLVRGQLDRLLRAPLSQRQLDAARRQLKGQLAVASDHHEGFALDMARTYLHRGEEKSLDHFFAQLDTISADELLHTARTLLAPTRLTTLVYR